MGIVAYCPSGHRMKVKDFLAGRKGICPTCGARFRIPMASPASPPARVPAPPAAARKAAADDPPIAAATASALQDIRIVADAGSSAVAEVVSLDPAAAVGLPELLMLADAAEAAACDDLPPEATVRVEPDPTADVEIAADDDPVADDDGDAAGVLFWYHAVPGGQPSAALGEAEMIAWLDSGQATGREVVWRSDWPGWKPISEAFPERYPPVFPGPGRW